MGLVILINYQNLRRAKIWFGLGFLGLLIGFVSQQDYRPIDDIEYSKNSRKTTYLLTLELIKENPAIGIGYGKFLKSFREHYAERKSTDPNIQLLGNNNMDHPHNEILFWTVEGGIVPLLGILFIVGSFLNIVWKAKKNIAWSQIIVLLPITIHLQLELPFYISAIHWFTFIFLTFIVDAEHGKKYVIAINERLFFKVSRKRNSLVGGGVGINTYIEVPEKYKFLKEKKCTYAVTQLNTDFFYKQKCKFD